MSIPDVLLAVAVIVLGSCAAKPQGWIALSLGVLALLADTVPLFRHGP
jgi:hypothetical protein